MIACLLIPGFELRAALRASWGAWDIALTAVVLGLVALIYVYFSFWIG